MIPEGGLESQTGVDTATEKRPGYQERQTVNNNRLVNYLSTIILSTAKKWVQQAYNREEAALLKGPANWVLTHR